MARNKTWLDKEPLARFVDYAFSDVEVMSIEYGIPDYVVIRITQNTGHEKEGKPVVKVTHATRKIKYDNDDRPYITVYQRRAYLDETVRRDTPWY